MGLPRYTSKKGYKKGFALLHAGGRKAVIHRMNSLRQKQKVADYARMHGVRPAAAHFGMHRKNIQRWLRERIEEVKGKKRKNRKGQGRKISYPREVDENILGWFLEKRDLQLAVSTEMLKQHARAVVSQVNPAFKASDGWAQKFMRRHNLVLRARTSMAQKLPGDLEYKVVAFRDEVQSIRSRTDIDYRLLGNMDETPVYFDIVPGKTLEVRGKKTVKVRTTGSEKRHITVVLACTACGDMMPPMIIFKGKTKRSIKGLEAPEGVIVAYQKKAWMDGDLMLKWIDGVWNKSCQFNQPGAESLLVMDSFSAHLTDDVKEKLESNKVHTIIVPGGCTSVLQPLDVSLNKPFKAILRRLWQQYMMESAEELERKRAEGNTPASQMKIPAPLKQMMVDWIVTAWLELAQKVDAVKKSFLVTGISNALGGYEDELVRNDELKAEIDELMESVFGSDPLKGMESDEDPDPLASDSESDPLDSDSDSEA